MVLVTAAAAVALVASFVVTVAALADPQMVVVDQYQNHYEPWLDWDTGMNLKDDKRFINFVTSCCTILKLHYTHTCGSC